MTRGLAAAAAVIATLVPRLAAACPACLSSAYGDRTYNWAYIGLLLMPFVIALVIAGLFAWSAGYRIRLPRRRPVLVARKVTLKETP